LGKGLSITPCCHSAICSSHRHVLEESSLHGQGTALRTWSAIHEIGRIRYSFADRIIGLLMNPTRIWEDEVMNLTYNHNIAVQSPSICGLNDGLMFIYSITNLKNGKKYIGLDTGSEKCFARVKSHFAAARALLAGKQLRCKSKIASAIAKHGADNFKWEVESTAQDFESLKLLEIAFIEKHDAIKNGYNIRPGGQGLPPNSEIKDLALLSEIQAVRLKGLKKANEARWAKSSAKEEMSSWLHIPEVSAKKSESVRLHWDGLTHQERQARSAQMKAGRRYEYTLRTDYAEDIDTNLRHLLNRHLKNLPESGKRIEQIVRENGSYNGGAIGITRKTR